MNNNSVELIGIYGDDELIACSAWTSTSRDKYYKSGIYGIFNKLNNKIYIGSSINIYKRINTHLRQLKNGNHINEYLLSSYNKYSIKSFYVIILEFCKVESLLERENYYMIKYNSYDRNKGYNQTMSSYSPIGYKHSKLDKLKMRYIKLGKKLSKNHINKIINSRKGYKHSDKTKEKISIANSGINNGMYGKIENQEHKTNRMKNFIKAPKWNIGKNKFNNNKMKLISEKLIGRKVYNSIKCKLTNKLTGKVFTANSLIELSKINNEISLPTINRLKNNQCGNKINNKYKLEILNES
jgi:hypothetical protein